MDKPFEIYRAFEKPSYFILYFVLSSQFTWSQSIVYFFSDSSPGESSICIVLHHLEITLEPYKVKIFQRLNI